MRECGMQERPSKQTFTYTFTYTTCIPRSSALPLVHAWCRWHLDSGM